MVKKSVKRGKEKSRKGKSSIHEKIFFVLLVLVLVLGSANIAKAKGWFIPQQPAIEFVDGTIDLDSMTLEQKIAQMVIVHGALYNLEAWQSMQVGGIHLFAMENADLYKTVVDKFQGSSQIPLFVTIDFEGCWNPFSNFKESLSVSEIELAEDAFQKGRDDGKFLNELGFTVNFAPVVDLNDEIWNCRSFPGDEKEISELAEAYILGLQSQNILATAKHYPGKTLVAKDPHKYLVTATIEEKDVYPYEYLSEKNEVSSFMVSHIITSGTIDSEGIPSVASEKVVNDLKQGFTGLIISDEINMLGLKDFYPTLDGMYLAVFKAGNDVIINFNEDPNEVYRMILVVKEAVERGEISEGRIDNSVRKILEAKGFKVR